MSYEFNTINHINYELIRKAKKNMQHFDQYVSNILVATYYESFSDAQNQSPGIIVFYDSFIAFSNTKGFFSFSQDSIQGTINYDDIYEISFYFKRILLKNFCFLMLFLKNGKRIEFNLFASSFAFLFESILCFSMDSRFPFTAIIPGISPIYGASEIEKGRYIFIHD